jgi:hypothetical protein
MRIGTAVGQILAVMLSAVAHAQSPDPLHSRECDAARVQLEHALDDASRKTAGSRERLAQARKQAIEACLGRESGERVRSGAPDPAVAVAPPVLVAPRALQAPAVVAPSPPAYVPAPVITSCDAGGCWDSNGQRANSLGPMLVGPRGVCSVAGGVVHCP